MVFEKLVSPWIQILQPSSEQDQPQVARLRRISLLEWRLSFLKGEIEYGQILTILRTIDKHSLAKDLPLSINVTRTSPNGQVAACIWEDGTIRPFSRLGDTWEEVIHGANRPSTLAFPPNGCFLAVGFFEGLVQTWDLENKCWGQIEGDHKTGESVAAISFSEDGRSLLWASHSLLWQVSIGLMSKEGLKYFEKQITAIIMPPLYSQLILANGKGKVHVREIGGIPTRGSYTDKAAYDSTGN